MNDERLYPAMVIVDLIEGVLLTMDNLLVIREDSDSIIVEGLEDLYKLSMDEFDPDPEDDDRLRVWKPDTILIPEKVEDFTDLLTVAVAVLAQQDEVGVTGFSSECDNKDGEAIFCVDNSDWYILKVRPV